MRADGAVGYLIGCVFLGAVLVPCTAAAHLLVTRRLGHLSGLVRGIGVFVTVSAAVWAVHVLPGLLGVLSPWTVTACAVLLVIAALRLPAVAPEPEDRAPAPPPEPNVSRLIAAVGVAASFAGAVALFLNHGIAPLGVDMTGNHMPQVAEWIRTGSIWQLTTHVPYVGTATYPQSGNVMLLAVTLPWRSTFAAGHVQIVFLAALAAAAYALARELGAPRAAAQLAAAAFCAMPAVSHFALRDPVVDVMMLAWFAAGALFLLRAERRGSRAELALAGCALGLSMGTKWYALPYVAIVFAIWAAARRRRGGGLVRDGGLLAGAIAAFGALWLVRNWALAGNPLHPVRVSAFGTTILDAPRDVVRERTGFSIWDYRGDAEVLRERIVPAWMSAFGLLGPALIVAGFAACLRRPFNGVLVAVGTAGLAIGLTYLVTPYTALGPRGNPYLTLGNSRYLVPALLASAALAAWLAGRSGRARPVAEGLLLVALLDALRRFPADLEPWHVMVVALAAAAVAAATIALWRLPAARLLPAATALTVVAALVVSARLWQRDPYFAHGRDDPAVAALQRHLPAGGRVGVAAQRAGALAPVLPAYGRRLDNRVEYVGRIEDGTLQPAADRAEFERMVRAAGYDALLLGTASSGRERPEAGWAAGLGYRVLARSPTQLVLTRRR